MKLVFFEDFVMDKKIIFIVCIVLIRTLAFGNETIQVVQGIADLSAVKFTSQKTVAVTGAWEFWWGQFIPLTAFQNNSQPNPDNYPVMPSYWTSKAMGNNTLHRELQPTGSSCFCRIMKSMAFI